MRRVACVLAACVLLLAACEARAPERSARQPEREPAASERAEHATARPKPDPEPAADSLETAGEIRYLELVTAGTDPEAELPMIIAIHGLGDTPEGFRAVLASFDRPARVILPRGLDPHEPGWSWFPIRARDPDIERLAAGIERAADTLAPAIAELVERRPTRGKPIVTGFSQGGMLSFALAVHHGELFSAAFPVGGWLPEPLWPTAAAGVEPELAPPIHAFHGEADTLVRYEPTRAAVEQLDAAGYRVELDSYPGVGHTIPRAMHADLMNALRETLSDPSGRAPPPE